MDELDKLFKDSFIRHEKHPASALGTKSLSDTGFSESYSTITLKSCRQTWITGFSKSGPFIPLTSRNQTVEIVTGLKVKLIEPPLYRMKLPRVKHYNSDGILESDTKDKPNLKDHPVQRMAFHAIALGDNGEVISSITIIVERVYENAVNPTKDFKMKPGAECYIDGRVTMLDYYWNDSSG
ncbi:hypothetical protein BGZ46_010567 [Entomortierella lignicola]|nr:hypothetical protein BGZ46_010567 [Entomortierella lignicola]